MQLEVVVVVVVVVVSLEAGRKHAKPLNPKGTKPKTGAPMAAPFGAAWAGGCCCLARPLLCTGFAAGAPRQHPRALHGSAREALAEDGGARALGEGLCLCPVRRRQHPRALRLKE